MKRVNFDISMSLEGLVAAMSDRRGGELRVCEDADAERIKREASRVIQTPLVSHLRVAVRQRAS